MCRIPISSLPLHKQRLLATSPLNPPMFLTIEYHYFDKATNATIYQICCSVQDGHDIISHSVKLRYSDIDKFDKSIRNEKNNNNKIIPNFPPKKIIGNTNEDFIKQREKDLQNYFNSLLQNQHIVDQKLFKELFFK